ncbi:MAG: succinate dehydrogenase iron-sulfur subunit [candidate division NC10 bacterium]|nr:succinate dehydrogenase iron-sulfur subunit [candidate division NC10 bacterium]
MSAQGYQFLIFRFDPEREKEPHFSSFFLNLEGSQSVLGALMEIQDRLDPSLAFRYSCRGAVCGSCGMVINGSLNLACKVLLSQLPEGPIIVEPLPHLEVEKDLVVNMEPFWKAYEQIQPWLHSREASPEKEYRVSEKERARIDQFINCILCACCYGACPVIARDPNYIGPAALAKLYRFVGDAREQRQYALLQQVDDPRGVWGCDTVFRCIDACPKDVRPTDGIASLRRSLMVRRFRRER